MTQGATHSTKIVTTESFDFRNSKKQMAKDADGNFASWPARFPSGGQLLSLNKPRLLVVQQLSPARVNQCLCLACSGGKPAETGGS